MSQCTDCSITSDKGLMIPDSVYKHFQQLAKDGAVPVPLMSAMYFVDTSYNFDAHYKVLAALWGKPNELNNSFDNSVGWWEKWAVQSGFVNTGAGDPATLDTAKRLSAAYSNIHGTNVTPQNIIPALIDTAKATGTVVSDNSPLAGILAFLGTLVNPGTWIRVGLFALFFLLMIAGFLIIIHGNEATAGGAS